MEAPSEVMSDCNIIISMTLASAVPIALIGGLCNRYRLKRGIGWQFIRYTVLTLSIPMVALLAINNLLSAEAATLIGTAMGFAFGKNDRKTGNGQ